MTALFEGLKKSVMWLRENTVLVLTLVASFLFLLLRRQQGKTASAEASQETGAAKATAAEVQSEIIQAEKDAKDARDNWDAFAAKYTDGK